MDPITWTGAAGTLLNPLLIVAAVALVLALIAQTVLSFAPGPNARTGPMTLSATRTPADIAGRAALWSLGLLAATVLAYLAAGILQSAPEAKGIIGGMASRFAAGLGGDDRRLRPVADLQAPPRAIRQALRQPHRPRGPRHRALLGLHRLLRQPDRHARPAGADLGDEERTARNANARRLRRLSRSTCSAATTSRATSSRAWSWARGRC
jgi:hypothetical protein